MEKDFKHIVWLASYPKSGNTWFRVFLSNLLSGKEEPVSINELYSTPIASSRSLFDTIAGVSGSDLTQEEIEELRPEVYRQIAMEAQETIFHKVHDAWRLTPSGKSMFPAEVTKGVIYFIRNPLDVTVSFAFHGSRPPGKMIRQVNNKNHAFCQKNDRIYNQLLQPLSDWSGHVKSWVDDSGLPVMVLRYEEMLNDTFNSFKAALEFIGLEKSDQEISKAIEASTIEKLSAMEKREGFTEKPLVMEAFFREGRAGSWKSYLAKEEIDTLINSQRAFIERFGYLK
jgi:aryl sulfotransferase